ncbi:MULTISPECIES: LOG family protein [unclassified Bradyrhizobium]
MQNQNAKALKSVCIFCGSSPGRDPIYLETAVATGQALAKAGITIVYGGGKVGLMGAVADAALAAGGRVVGVIPRALVEREIGHTGLSQLHIVETMHERKTMMAELSDGFIALPGGAGTLEELFEEWTWAQLGIHQKPCGLLNVKDYFAPLMAMVERMVAEGFTIRAYAEILIIETKVEALLRRFAAYQPPPRKWLRTDAAAKP